MKRKPYEKRLQWGLRITGQSISDGLKMTSTRTSKPNI